MGRARSGAVQSSPSLTAPRHGVLTPSHTILNHTHTHTHTHTALFPPMAPDTQEKRAARAAAHGGEAEASEVEAEEGGCIPTAAAVVAPLAPGAGGDDASRIPVATAVTVLSRESTGSVLTNGSLSGAPLPPADDGRSSPATGAGGHAVGGVGAGDHGWLPGTGKGGSDVDARPPLPPGGGGGRGGSGGADSDVSGSGKGSTGSSTGSSAGNSALLLSDPRAPASARASQAVNAEPFSSSGSSVRSESTRCATFIPYILFIPFYRFYPRPR